MKKILVIGLLVIVSLVTITGCKKDSKKDDRKDNKVDDIVDTEPTVDKIELGKGQYIEQLEKVYIEDTEDYLMITKKVKWEVPEQEKGTTTSFSIMVPYTLHVDGVDYPGEYQLGDYSKGANDQNPKYDFAIVDLSSNYETKILLNKKKD